MILYHGTNIDFFEIDTKKSKPNKNFGKGFYLSKDKDQAMRMAEIKVEQLESGNPIVQAYEFDEATIDMLHVKKFDGYSEEWARFILLNRNNATDIPAHNYDIVIGPIADDRVGFQLWRYESGIIDLNTLMDKLKYMKGLTLQYFFGTEKAIKLLKRL